MQNGTYDSIHSIRYHAYPRNWVLDTMALAHCEYSELPQTLDFIASYHLYDYIYWKDDADAAKKGKDIKKYWAYNAKDSWNTMRIALSQVKNMPAYARANYKTQFKLVYPAIYCAFEGIKIDNIKRKSLRAESDKQLNESLDLLQTMFADPNFNPGSWQQVEKYIYKVFGAKRPKIGKSKSCTDEKNLNAVAEQHPLLAKLTEQILSYRGAQKAIGTYFDFEQLNERLLYSLDPFGTETDRMACRASSLWVGTQVQNIPSYAKPMLIADEGYELVEVDNKQSEARCTAYCAQEEALIAALESATHDFYRTLGTLFFNIPYEEVSDFFRNKVLKKIVHGTNYMMGAATFIENIGVQILHETANALGLKLVPIPTKNHPEEKTIKQFAKELLDAYHEPFPGVREWYKKIYNEINVTGKLVSPLGHTRAFFGDIKKNHTILRGAVAHQPQNLSVAILNKGLWKVYKELVIPSAGEFRLKAQVHDSILAQYLKTKRDYYIPKMQELMDNPVIVHGRTLRIPTDAKYGVNWKDCIEYKR
jgi:DNA polymerase I-like protein with 3'-5' exonuclease and polymerase domains